MVFGNSILAYAEGLCLFYCINNRRIIQDRQRSLSNVLKDHPEKKVEYVTVRRKKELIAEIETMVVRVYNLEF